MTSELQAYFKGELTSFSVECTPKGTIFQKKVWQYLLTTPYGALRTYKDVAKAVGSHPRAVGGAIGKNPIPIIIPCHRVIATNGKMCGFSGGKGIETKEILLELEKKNK
ncbi:MAG: methylated-DNA-[protein]-cysteine S-methyltransferase [Alphaproteobacteria bacterium]|jgi:methylated-DNA-[protein]-cysteine S-methyltransferase